MAEPADDLVQDLLTFIDRAPTPYHAVAESARRLDAIGFQRLSETSTWELPPDARAYVVRNDGTIAAFVVGTASATDMSIRALGAHTDSPNLRLKPCPDLYECGYHQLSMEPYGGVLLYTWLDRELSLAGRATVSRDGRPVAVLVDFVVPILRVPSLAIHLQREIREEGVRLNPQLHVSPILGIGLQRPFAEMLAARIQEASGEATGPQDVLAFDLMAYEVTPGTRTGLASELLSAPRLDNLASCHAAVTALSRSARRSAAETRLIVLYDHEEVGSRTAAGAGGPFLSEVVDRIVAARGGDPRDTPPCLARSTLVSVDMAHAVHPNWSDRHERNHRPILGGGPVVKDNVKQSYATDARTAGVFVSACRSVDVAIQHFVSRSDLACGSTIGPISAARVGIGTVDVGSPMLAMHSCRETAAAADVEPMVRALTAFLDH